MGVLLNLPETGTEYVTNPLPYAMIWNRIHYVVIILSVKDS